LGANPGSREIAFEGGAFRAHPLAPAPTGGSTTWRAKRLDFRAVRAHFRGESRRGRFEAPAGTPTLNFPKFVARR
jgi:hypothetical protein